MIADWRALAMFHASGLPVRERVAQCLARDNALVAKALPKYNHGRFSDECAMVRHIPFELSDADCTVKAVHSRGPGGQHVNKSSTAVQLFFNVQESSLPEELKARVLERYERRLSADGCIVLKACGERSRELNRRAVLLRLHALIEKAAEVPDARKPTRPTRASQERRLKQKTVRAAIKKMRSAAIRDAE